MELPFNLSHHVGHFVSDEKYNCVLGINSDLRKTPFPVVTSGGMSETTVHGAHSSLRCVGVGYNNEPNDAGNFIISGGQYYSCNLAW